MCFLYYFAGLIKAIIISPEADPTSQTAKDRLQFVQDNTLSGGVDVGLGRCIEDADGGDASFCDSCRFCGQFVGTTSRDIRCGAAGRKSGENELVAGCRCATGNRSEIHVQTDAGGEDRTRVVQELSCKFEDEARVDVGGFGGRRSSVGKCGIGNLGARASRKRD